MELPASLDWIDGDELLPYNSRRLVYEASLERGYLERVLDAESFLSPRERYALARLRDERKELLEKGEETEASIADFYINRYVELAEKRKQDDISWHISSRYNPYPRLFDEMPTEEEIDEAQCREVAYEIWRIMDCMIDGTDTPGEVYDKLLSDISIH